jgi:hypothetical protein
MQLLALVPRPGQPAAVLAGAVAVGERHTIRSVEGVPEKAEARAVLGIRTRLHLHRLAAVVSGGVERRAPAVDPAFAKWSGHGYIAAATCRQRDTHEHQEVTSSHSFSPGACSNGRTARETAARPRAGLFRCAEGTVSRPADEFGLTRGAREQAHGAEHVVGEVRQPVDLLAVRGGRHSERIL